MATPSLLPLVDHHPPCAATGALGKERVIASTDCGLGGRVHAEIAWAKPESTAQGATLASLQLWR